MRPWRNAPRLLAAGIVMLGTGLPLAGAAGPASAASLRPAPAAAPSPAQVAELTASDGTPDSGFGWSVAVTPDGNTALISAPSPFAHPAAAYVFTRTWTGWRQTAKLTPGDVGRDYFFGNSVALSADGNTALIGADYTAGYMGAAYVFTRTWAGWRQTAKLTAADGDYDGFGNSVALAADGNTALIGANFTAGYMGAAYVFTRTWAGWRQTAKLTAADGVDHDRFGFTVALAADGNTALIGAPDRDTSTGAAYVFTRTWSGWQQTAELTATNGAAEDGFGSSVAATADGRTALIGANEPDSSGAAYVFTRTWTGWQQTAELTARDGASFDWFGQSVAITPDGNTALIGAVHHDSSGAAYLFTRTWSGWQQTTELTASDGASADSFGQSLAITPDGNTALIGAFEHDSATGVAYLFAGPPWW